MFGDELPRASKVSRQMIDDWSGGDRGRGNQVTREVAEDSLATCHGVLAIVGHLFGNFGALRGRPGQLPGAIREQVLGNFRSFRIPSAIIGLPKAAGMGISMPHT